MHPQDIADQQRLVGRARRFNDALGGFQGVGERLLTEDVRARFKRLERHWRVMLGVGADRDRVGFERRQRFGQALEARQAWELDLQIMAPSGIAGAQADELETVDRPIGARVAQSHRAEPYDENALRLHAGACAISHSCAGSLWKRHTRFGPAITLR
jgi:hypothetical protein